GSARPLHAQIVLAELENGVIGSHGNPDQATANCEIGDPRVEPSLLHDLVLDWVDLRNESTAGVGSPQRAVGKNQPARRCCVAPNNSTATWVDACHCPLLREPKRTAAVRNPVDPVAVDLEAADDSLRPLVDSEHTGSEVLVNPDQSAAGRESLAGCPRQRNTLL